MLLYAISPTLSLIHAYPALFYLFAFTRALSNCLINVLSKEQVAV